MTFSQIPVNTDIINILNFMDKICMYFPEFYEFKDLFMSCVFHFIFPFLNYWFIYAIQFSIWLFTFLKNLFVENTCGKVLCLLYVLHFLHSMSLSLNFMYGVWPQKSVLCLNLLINIPTSKCVADDHYVLSQ